MLRSLVAAAVLAASTMPLAQSAYVPARVFDAHRAAFADFEVLLADLTTADVVFVGEQHDDPNTHRLELALLEGLARRRSNIVVALEMFERDVQEPLDHFQMGHLTEADFLKGSRPWPNYATDYKPLVDFAIAHEWPVVAGNVPRAIASEVSTAGLGVLAAKSGDEKQWFARDLQCPTDDAYFGRFREAMGDHPAGDATVDAQRQMLERFYFAQCLKDETMAESVAQVSAAGASSGTRPLVVHYNGAFHSDFSEGTVARAKRRLPGRRIVVVSILPMATLDSLAPTAIDRTRADWLIYTIGK